MNTFFYLLLLIGIGYYAKSKGRNPILWALLALFITPVVVAIILYFMKDLSTSNYDGDTIDTTARPVPDEMSSRSSTRNNKPKVDVDDSIRRMEEKLSQSKSSDLHSDDGATALIPLSTESILTPVDETIIIEKNAPQSEITEEVIQDSNVTHDFSVEENTVTNNNYCESCGQPLSNRAKFCTNCGAPVAK